MQMLRRKTPLDPDEESNYIPQALYDQITKYMPIVSVEAIIISNGATLFLRRNNHPAKGEWWFPGGRIRKGESLLQALQREVKEETGLEITSHKLIDVYSRVFPERHDIAIVFLCKCGKGNVKLNDEHSEYRFSKTAPDNLHRFMAETIRDALETLNDTTYKKRPQS
jgi:ADP-ribose pyrophosphatase YjhB (NUDIX family)